MIDAAIVGLGRWGRTLVEAVQGKSERLRFTHAVSRNPEAVRDYAARLRLHVVGDLEAALADPATGAVVLATPHSLHRAQIEAAAAAGKAVFCEKPLALTRAEAARAVAACERAGVAIGVGHDKRWFPAMQELARIVASGSLGRILHVEANFSNEVSAPVQPAWRYNEEEAPAAGLTATGIHVLDALVRMVGPLRRVSAVELRHKPPPDPHDSIAALLEFESGVSGTLASIRSTPMFWRVHVFGRDGSAEALGRSELVLRRSREVPQRLTFDEIDSVRANLEAFADAAAGVAPYPIPPAQLVDTVAAFEAIVTAARSGTAVSL
jgi:predicted dehydrogenase